MSVASGNSATSRSSRQSTTASVKSDVRGGGKRTDSTQFRPPLPTVPPPEQYPLPETVKPTGKLNQFARKDVKYALEVKSVIASDQNVAKKRVLLITTGSVILINTENGLKIAANIPTTHITDVQLTEVSQSMENLFIITSQAQQRGGVSVVVPKNASAHNTLPARVVLSKVLENVQQRKFKIGQQLDLVNDVGSQQQSEPDQGDVHSTMTDFLAGSVDVNQLQQPNSVHTHEVDVLRQTMSASHHDLKSLQKSSPDTSVNSDYSNSGLCPHCSSDIVEPTHKYCPQCGGRLPFDASQQVLISNKAPILSRLAVLKRSMADVDIGFVPNDDDDIAGLTDGMKTSIIKRQQGAIAALKKHVESQAKFTAEQALQLDQLQAQIVDDLSSVSDTTLLLGFSSDEEDQKGEVKRVIHAPVWRDGQFHQLPPEDIIEPSYPTATSHEKQELKTLRDHIDSITKGNYLEHLRKESTSLQKQIAKMSKWAKQKRREERQRHRTMRTWVDSQVKEITTDAPAADSAMQEAVKEVLKKQEEQQNKLFDLQRQQDEVKEIQKQAALSPPPIPVQSSSSLSQASSSRRPTLKKSKSNISTELIKKVNTVPLYPVTVSASGKEVDLDTQSGRSEDEVNVHRSVSQLTVEDARWARSTPPASSGRSGRSGRITPPAAAAPKTPTFCDPESAVHLMPASRTAGRDPPPPPPPPKEQTRFVSPPKVIKQARWIAPTAPSDTSFGERERERERERDRAALRKIYFTNTNYD